MMTSKYAEVTVAAWFCKLFFIFCSKCQGSVFSCHPEYYAAGRLFYVSFRGW